jgi:acyl-CoA thioesterase FadM
VVWAALDCPSGIAAAEAAELPAGTAVVLGRMAATVAALPRPGDRCRVVAWPLAVDGRKLRAGSAVLGPGGELLAAAATVWVTVARRAVAGGGAAP